MQALLPQHHRCLPLRVTVVALLRTAIPLWQCARRTHQSGHDWRVPLALTLLVGLQLLGWQGSSVVYAGHSRAAQF